MPRLARGGDPVEDPEDEFVLHLNRGSEQLAAGDAAAARASLESALALRPKDAKVLSLLGQACYRQGLYDDAVVAWQRLVDENPVEPAARVNLGLALLKAKRYPEARKELEIALDMNPEHRKAMGYLGLALLESGSPAEAREWFRKAGSGHMVARCDEVIAGGWQTVALATPIPEPTPGPGGTPILGTPGAFAAVGAAPAGEVLSAWAAARRVEVEPDEVFSVRDGVVTVAVRGTVLSRLDGLFAVRGAVTLAGELKRFRGRATDKPFGEGATRMHRARGTGELLHRAGDRRFTSLALDGDAAYLREEVVFGLEDGLAFENGRVPSSSAVELNLVHLRGRGRFLLATAGEPVSLEVTPAAPLRVPLPALVGWMGGLTPRIVPLAEGWEVPGVVVVELAGEGRVLADPAAVGEEG